MAELLPAALGWIDQKKKAIRDTLAQALAEAQATPLESLMNAARGTARGAMQLGDAASSTMWLPAQTDNILPSNGSAVSDITEALGPPLKMGLKGVAGLATLIPALPHKIMELKALEGLGRAAPDVWRETGATRIPGGGIATEVPDLPAQLKLPEGRYAGSGTLADFYDHPELYKQQPGIDKTPFSWQIGATPAGGYNFTTGGISVTGRTPEEIKLILSHEIQHRVQQQAGWAGGSSPEAELLRQKREIGDQLETRGGLGGPVQWERDMDKIQSAYPAGLPFNESNSIADLLYHHQAGEAQSRAVEARSKMSPQELAAIPPSADYDVPIRSLLLKYLPGSLPVKGVPQ